MRIDHDATAILTNDNFLAHLDVELKKGVHSIRLTNAYAKTPDIDFMRVEKR